MRNKKGFSLIELLVVVAILGIFAAILVPSFGILNAKSDKKLDEAALSNLETALVVSIQNNSIYKDARKIADKSTDHKIRFVYSENSFGELTLESCYIKVEAGEISDTTPVTEENKVGELLAALKEAVSGAVNGKIEPIVFQSTYHENKKYEFTITFTDAEFKVTSSMDILQVQE